MFFSRDVQSELFTKRSHILTVKHGGYFLLEACQDGVRIDGYSLLLGVKTLRSACVQIT